MADIKKFIFLDANGNTVEQSEQVSIEVDAATTARGVVNKSQMESAIDTKASEILTNVGNQIAFTDSRVTALDGTVNARFNNLDSYLTDTFAAETSARQAADAAINTRIDNLDTGNSASLQAEITRATAEEARLAGLISTEQAARTLADGQLGDAITSEAQARSAADTALGLRIDGVSADLATEITNRQSAVSAEATERAAQDSLLSGRIDAEVTRATAAEGSLRTDLNAEISARQNADSALQGEIDAEESLRASEITRVEGLITAETSARTAADVALGGRIDTEITDRIAAVLAEKTRAEGIEAGLRADLTTEIADRAAAVLAEKNRAEAIEAGLRTDLTQETADRIAAVSAEQTRASDAEGVLTTNLSNEIARATGEEQRIEAKFDAAFVTERQIRADADSALRTDLTAEINRAGAAEGLLRTDLTAETARATAAEGVLTNDLAAEISRATAEEIAVENRAKAYADARVQGLKPKNSVDFALTRFQPYFLYDSASDSVLHDKYRLVYPMSLGDGTDALPAFSPLIGGANGSTPTVRRIDYEVGDSELFVFWRDLSATTPGAYEWVSDAVSQGTGDGQGWSLSQAVQYRYAGGSAQTQAEGALNWFNNNGYRWSLCSLEMIDLLEGTNLEKFVQALKTANQGNGGIVPSDLATSGLRVAIVQNNIGSSYDWVKRENKEAPGSYYPMFYLNRADIEALPVEQRQEARNEAINLGNSGVGLGIYVRNLVDGAPVWSRAPDFAVGQEVSGAYFVSERSVVGGMYAHTEQGAGGYDVWFNTMPTSLTAPNVGLVVSPREYSSQGASLTVGTSALTFTLFNRVGAYQFNDGFKAEPHNPTSFSVRPDYYNGIIVQSSGVGVNLPGPSIAQHIQFEPDTPGSVNGPRHINVTGPLVGGMVSVLEEAEGQYYGITSADAKAFHIHAATYLKVTRWPTQRNAETGAYEGALVTDGAVGAGMHTFHGGNAYESIVPATWDSPNYIGIASWVETMPEAQYNNPGYDVNTGLKGRVALAGTGTAWLSGINSFAIGEMVYLGGAQNTYSKFADVPSGKYAVPVGLKIGDARVKLVDRPATLKA